MADIRAEIKGEGQASRLGDRLIAAGAGELKERLYKAIRDANMGIEADIRRSALTHLPKRGGLAGAVATARIHVSRVNGLGVGIEVTANHQYDLAGLDDGLDVHPLFGDKRHWYAQRVRRHWFTDAVNNRTEQTRYAIDRAVKQYLNDL